MLDTTLVYNPIEFVGENSLSDSLHCPFWYAAALSGTHSAHNFTMLHRVTTTTLVLINPCSVLAAISVPFWYSGSEEDGLGEKEIITQRSKKRDGGGDGHDGNNRDPKQIGRHKGNNEGGVCDNRREESGSKCSSIPTVASSRIPNTPTTPIIVSSAVPINSQETAGIIQTPHASTHPVPDTDGPSSPHIPPVGAIIGGVIGGLVFLALLAGLWILSYRRRKNRLAPSTTHRAASDHRGWLQISDSLDDSRGVFRPDLKYSNTVQDSNRRANADVEAALQHKAEIMDDLRFEAAVRDGVKA
ncbi:hypothetical protein BDZ94DRAFT_1320919 [Collybia nuda]|uniref:Uncharacterized protein n=1 Tax=Collybia nuda TaxID=64659 RepID=A0A9P5Y6N4_9AGAR|nr:hypothetical protein BDZ94DRAFT_1320919 [Collybia nuda]